MVGLVDWSRHGISPRGLRPSICWTNGFWGGWVWKRPPAFPHGRRTKNSERGVGACMACACGCSRLGGAAFRPRLTDGFSGLPPERGGGVLERISCVGLGGPWVASRVAPPRVEVANSSGDPSRATYTRTRAADRAAPPDSQPAGKAQRATEKR